MVPTEIGTRPPSEDSSRLGRWLPWMRVKARRMVGPGMGTRLSPSSIVQQAALAYWKKRGRLAGLNSRQVAGWLAGAMRLGLLTKLAEGRRGPETLPLGIEPTGREPEADEQALRDELHRRLIEAVGRLDERSRQVVVWHRDEGLSHEEIGRRLGISAGNSAVIHHRAIRKLREILAGDEGPAGDGA